MANKRVSSVIKWEQWHCWLCFLACQSHIQKEKQMRQGGWGPLCLSFCQITQPPLCPQPIRSNEGHSLKQLSNPFLNRLDATQPGCPVDTEMAVGLPCSTTWQPVTPWCQVTSPWPLSSSSWDYDCIFSGNTTECDINCRLSLTALISTKEGERLMQVSLNLNGLLTCVFGQAFNFLGVVQLLIWHL